MYLAFPLCLTCSPSNHTSKKRGELWRLKAPTALTKCQEKQFVLLKRQALKHYKLHLHINLIPREKEKNAFWKPMISTAVRQHDLPALCVQHKLKQFQLNLQADKLDECLIIIVTRYPKAGIVKSEKATTRCTYSRCNKYASNNRVTSITVNPLTGYDSWRLRTLVHV
jgi:hypothetical protein